MFMSWLARALAVVAICLGATSSRAEVRSFETRFHDGTLYVDVTAPHEVGAGSPFNLNCYIANDTDYWMVLTVTWVGVPDLESLSPWVVRLRAGESDANGSWAGPEVQVNTPGAYSLTCRVAIQFEDKETGELRNRGGYTYDFGSLRVSGGAPGSSPDSPQWLPREREVRVDGQTVVFSSNAVQDESGGFVFWSGFLVKAVEEVLPFYLGFDSRTGNAYVAIAHQYARFDIFSVSLTARADLAAQWAGLVVGVEARALGVPLRVEVPATEILSTFGGLANVTLCEGTQVLSNVIGGTIHAAGDLSEAACEYLQRVTSDAALVVGQGCEGAVGGFCAAGGQAVQGALDGCARALNDASAALFGRWW